MLLFGPPRLTVVANSPAEPVTIVAEHADGVDHVSVSVRVFTRDGREVASRRGTVAEQPASGADQRRFLLSTTASLGAPAVAVIRGTHGEDGPFMEAMVQLDARGGVVGITYSQRASLLGGSTFPPFSERDIESALRAVETRHGP